MGHASFARLLSVAKQPRAGKIAKGPPRLDWHQPPPPPFFHLRKTWPERWKKKNSLKANPRREECRHQKTGPVIQFPVTNAPIFPFYFCQRTSSSSSGNQRVFLFKFHFGPFLAAPSNFKLSINKSQTLDQPFYPALWKNGKEKETNDLVLIYLDWMREMMMNDLVAALQHWRQLPFTRDTDRRLVVVNPIPSGIAASCRCARAGLFRNRIGLSRPSSNGRATS